MVAADPSSIGPALHRPVVLYMGSCPFCRATARLMRRLDRHDRLAFLPFDDADAQPFLDKMPEAERESSWHLLRPDESWASGGAATVELLGYLNGFRTLGRMISFGHLTWIVSLLYRAVSSLRPQLSRLCSGSPGPRVFP